jgi:hypothetical protein
MKSAIMNFFTRKKGIYVETKKKVQEQAYPLEQGQNDSPEVTVEPETNPFYPPSPEGRSPDAGIGAV